MEQKKANKFVPFIIINIDINIPSRFFINEIRYNLNNIFETKFRWEHVANVQMLRLVFRHFLH